MIHDLITAFLVAFAAVTASEVLTKDLGIVLAGCDRYGLRQQAERRIHPLDWNDGLRQGVLREGEQTSLTAISSNPPRAP